MLLVNVDVATLRSECEHSTGIDVVEFCMCRHVLQDVTSVDIVHLRGILKSKDTALAPPNNFSTMRRRQEEGRPQTGS